MTQANKDKIEHKTNWIPKVLTPALLIAIGVILWDGSASITNMDSRTFPDTETRTRVLDHVNESPNEVDVYIQFKELKTMRANDSIERIYKLDAIQRRAKREVRDSARAVDLWKLTKAVEKINEKINIEE